MFSHESLFVLHTLQRARVCVCVLNAVFESYSHSPAAFTPLSSEHRGSQECAVPLCFVRFQAERCDWLLVVRGAEPLIGRQQASGGAAVIYFGQKKLHTARDIPSRHYTQKSCLIFWLTWGTSELKMMMFVCTRALMKNYFLWPVA